MAAASANEQVLYEPEEACSTLLALGVAVQGVMLVLAPTVLIVAVTVTSSGQDDSYLTWALFAMLLINAVTTTLQALRAGRVGAGHMVITGPTLQFVLVMVAAVSEGGPELLASLLVVSSLFQFALAAWLPVLRRIITPVVSGIVLMLVAATVLPVAVERLREVPDGVSPAVGPSVALVTLAVSVALSVRGPVGWRPWSPIISIGVGCALSAALGAYEFQRIIDAPWFGVPEPRFPGFDLTPGVEFWALLPTFAILTLVLGIKTISDSMVIQQASRREPRATDFRTIQGAVNANGIGMVLSGIAGTPPSSTYSSFSVSLINITGVASARVGYAVAVVFVVMALFSKFAAALLTVPDPVMGAYLLLVLGLFFVGGMQTVFKDGVDAQKALVVALSFAIGLGVHGNDVVSDVLGEPLGALLGNGVMVGTMVAVCMTAFMEWTNPRPARLDTELDMEALAGIDEFLRDLAANMGWDEAATERLRSAGEETLATLTLSRDRGAANGGSRLAVTARPGGGGVDLEFVAAVEQENIEDKLAYLSDEMRVPDASEVSLRLLRHYASAVQHQKYHGIDIVTVRVDTAR